MKESQIDRRIDFLIREAKSKDPIRDQVVTYAFRTITNYFSVGCDARSWKLRKECRYRSKKAHDLYKLYEELDDPKRWFDEVTNEHQYPIKRAWKWMKEERKKLTLRRVKNHLKKWPVVVVTKEENRKLKDDPTVGPDHRYRKAGIKVLKKNDSGVWLPFSPNQISD
jgi:hypothetical protein